jgi:RNA polymerase sigma factor (sigma-70 family)
MPKNISPELLADIERFAKAAAHAILANEKKWFVDLVVSKTVTAYSATFDDELQPSNLQAWVNTVARNHALNVVRSENTLTSRITFDPTAADSAASESKTPFEVLESKEHLEALLRLLRMTNAVVQQLSDEDRELYSLIFEKRKSLVHISEHVGEKPNVVSQKWGRLLKAIAKRLHQKVKNDPLCNDVFSALLNSGTEWKKHFPKLLRAVAAEWQKF